MDSNTISRYQNGGDIYNTLASSYGTIAADLVAAAAATGSDASVQSVLENVRTNAGYVTGQKSTSTLGIFADQILTDPLAAPLKSANNALGNSFLSVLKSPWVMLAGVILLFSVMGGWGWLGKKVFAK